MEELKPGDTVRLNSGGPLMTVETIEDGKCKCTWFDDKKKMTSATFAIVLLCKDDGSWT